MIGALIEIGDVVRIDIPHDSREWGYNPCPDGTRATVVSYTDQYIRRTDVGLYRLPPGVYENREWVNLRLSDNQPHTEWAARLTLLDEECYARRRAAYRGYEHYRCQFIRPLPPLTFWEGDSVYAYDRDRTRRTWELMDGRASDVHVVQYINYHYLAMKRLDGSPMPEYCISSSLYAGWTTSANETGLELVERGLVWCAYHGYPIVLAEKLQKLIGTPDLWRPQEST